MEKKKTATILTCPYCGKTYKKQNFFDTHVKRDCLKNPDSILSQQKLAEEKEITKEMNLTEDEQWLAQYFKGKNDINIVITNNDRLKLKEIYERIFNSKTCNCKNSQAYKALYRYYYKTIVLKINK